MVSAKVIKLNKVRVYQFLVGLGFFLTFADAETMIHGGFNSSKRVNYFAFGRPENISDTKQLTQHDPTESFCS